MDNNIWENLIALNAHVDIEPVALGSVASFVAQDDGAIEWDRESYPLKDAIARDPYPLPQTANREGYYGENHFNYWASGLLDYLNVSCLARDLGIQPRRCFELGAATARVLRHFALQSSGVEAVGADINLLHARWVSKYLPPSVTVFHNHSIPHLPFPDDHFCVVTAFSVFTHLEVFDVAWLLELRRILRPGGVAWITVMTEKSWAEMTPHWPAYKGIERHPEFSEKQQGKPFEEDRLIFRWRSEASYSSNVFVHTSYVRRVFGSVMPILAIKRRCPHYQDVVVFQKQ